MAKIVRLTESDLTRLVKRVIIESELDIQPGDLTPEVNVSSSELDQATQEGGKRLPIIVKALNTPIGNEITKTLKQYCDRGDSKESILSFLKGKLSEFRQEKKQKETQIQEQPMVQAILSLVGFIVLMLILIRIFRGNDGCRRYTRFRNKYYMGS